MSGNGGAGGMPGVKKNKTMNAYKAGGMVSGMSKGTIKGGGKAQRGLGFTTSN